MLTVTPASMVNVTPVFTLTGPSKEYGLFAFVHVVSEFIIWLTGVEAYTVPKPAVDTKTMLLAKKAIKSKPRRCISGQFL